MELVLIREKNIPVCPDYRLMHKGHIPPVRDFMIIHPVSVPPLCLTCIPCIHPDPGMASRALNRNRFSCLLQAGKPWTKIYPFMVAAMADHKAAWELHTWSHWITWISTRPRRSVKVPDRSPIGSVFVPPAPLMNRTWLSNESWWGAKQHRLEKLVDRLRIPEKLMYFWYGKGL